MQNGEDAGVELPLRLFIDLQTFSAEFGARVGDAAVAAARVQGAAVRGTTQERRNNSSQARSS
jgi:hypothetical protein